MRDFTELATLEEWQRQTEFTADNERYREFLSDASRFICAVTRRWFVPWRGTLSFDARGQHVSANTLKVRPHDLLEIKTLTNGNSSAIASSGYVLRPSNVYPKHTIRLKDSASTYFTYSTDWEDAISVDGIWGFHSDYANAWVNTGETVPVGNITAGATSITLSDVDGRDYVNRIRCQTYMILKIEDEFLKITAVDTSANTITVLRGVLGTTAASHAAGTTIYSWNVQPDVKKCALDLAVWMERHRKDSGETIQFLDGTIVSTNEVPSNITRTLMHYTRTELFSI